MSRRVATVGYVVCTMRYPIGEEVLPEDVIAYHRDAARVISGLTVEGLKADEASDVDELLGEDGSELCEERFWFEVMDGDAFEGAVAGIVAAVRELGIADDHDFQVEKHVLKGDDREIERGRIEPKGDVRWTAIGFEDWKDEMGR